MEEDKLIKKLRENMNIELAKKVAVFYLETYSYSGFSDELKIKYFDNVEDVNKFIESDYMRFASDESKRKLLHISEVIIKV